jgi:predicted nucleic acid-binding protein
MSGMVLVDSGPLVAYLDASDQFHEWAVERFSELPAPFLVPEAVISETCFLLAEVPRAIAKVGDWLQRGVLVLAPIGGAAQPRIFALMEKYRQIPMSYADACLIWLAEVHAPSRVFTLDADFTVYRLDRRRAVPVIASFLD